MRARRLIHGVGLLLLGPWLAWGDVVCNGTTDTMVTTVAMASLIADTAATMVAIIKHTGSLDAGGPCGRERITGDAHNLMGLAVDDDPSFEAHHWTGASQCAVGPYTADVWKHLVWRHAAGNLDLFIDGVLAQTVAAGTTTGLGNLVHVCGTGWEVGDFTAMTVGEVSYYNVALSDNTIAACGKAKLKRCGAQTPTAQWDFDSVGTGASGTGVGHLDRSGNNRTLTATGTTGTGSTYLTYQVGGIQ